MGWLIAEMPHAVLFATSLETLEGFVSGRSQLVPAIRSDSLGGPGMLGW